MSHSELLPTNVQHYILNHSLREHPVLQALREKTATLPNAHMMSAPEESQFVALLIQMIQAKRVIEVGIFTGYTTLAMALALPKDGQLIACDINPDYPAIGQPFWQQAGVAARIDLRINDAKTTLQSLLPEATQQPFDLIYIDADKTPYGDYYELALRLVRPHGIIAIDNTLGTNTVHPYDARDHSAMAETLRAFNQKLHHDSRVILSILPIAQGLTLALKKP